MSGLFAEAAVTLSVEDRAVIAVALLATQRRILRNSEIRLGKVAPLPTGTPSRVAAQSDITVAMLTGTTTNIVGTAQVMNPGNAGHRYYGNRVAECVASAWASYGK